MIGNGQKISSESSSNWKVIQNIVAMLTVAATLITAINGVLTNYRDSNRLLAEQQHKIRVTYLDKLLAPNISVSQQQQIFKLLSKLSADKELQAWAKEELINTTGKLDSLVKLKNFFVTKDSVNRLRIDSLLRTDNERKNKQSFSETRIKTLQAEIVASNRRKNEIQNLIKGSADTESNLFKFHVSSSHPFQAIPNLLVVFKPQDGGDSLTAMTNKNGDGSLNLPVGRYFADMKHDGFFDRREIFTIRDVDRKGIYNFMMMRNRK